jgi:hypothetical protein
MIFVFEIQKKNKHKYKQKKREIKKNHSRNKMESIHAIGKVAKKLSNASSLYLEECRDMEVEVHKANTSNMEDDCDSNDEFEKLQNDNNQQDLYQNCSDESGQGLSMNNNDEYAEEYFDYITEDSDEDDHVNDNTHQSFEEIDCNDVTDDSSGDSDDEFDNDNNNANEEELYDFYYDNEKEREKGKLYGDENQITIRVALILILNFIVTAKLSKTQIKALFDLLLKILPENTILRKFLSFNKFYNRFKLSTPFQKVFFCQDCNYWNTQHNNRECQCRKCMKSFFWMRDPISIIHKLLFKKEILEEMKEYREKAINMKKIFDCQSCSLYKKLVLPLLNSADDLFVLEMNVDGLSPFSRSKKKLISNLFKSSRFTSI